MEKRKGLTDRKKVVKKNKTPKMIMMTIGAVVLLCAIILAPVIYDSYFLATTVSGMTLLDANVGNKSEDELSILVDVEIAKSKTVKIHVQDKFIEVDLNATGFMIDKEKTIEEMKNLGKKNIFAAIKYRFVKPEVVPIIKSDYEEFEAVIEQLLTEEGIVGNNFTYAIANNIASITISEKVNGIDKEHLFNEILESYNDLKETYIAKELPPSFPTSQQIETAINIPVFDAKIDYSDGRTKIIMHQVGLAIDKDVLNEKLQKKEISFKVPLNIIKPKVFTDDLGEEIFPDVLYSYTTNYNEGEVARTTNVKIATQKINGTILNPEDIFSYNKVVGKRSYENGFKDAKIFLADKVVDDVGGGICQVSSTIYPVALYSDMKIIERRNHTFVVSYAKPGVDATVAYGSIDFKFQNNKQNPVKIKAYASGGKMTVSIIGKKENDNKVEVTTQTLSTTPRPVKYEHNSALVEKKEVVIQGGYDGKRVQSYRIVKDSSGATIRKDNLGISNYATLARIIQTSDETLTGTIQGEKPAITPIPTELPKPTASPSVTLPATSPSPSKPKQTTTPNSTPTIKSTPTAKGDIPEL